MFKIEELYIHICQNLLFFSIFLCKNPRLYHFLDTNLIIEKRKIQSSVLIQLLK